VAALGVKQPELRETQVFDVTVAIEDGEGVAAFKHTRAIIHQGRGCADVILIGNPDNVRQKTEPSN
jgi:hypothetical protein